MANRLSATYRKPTLQSVVSARPWVTAGLVVFITIAGLILWDLRFPVSNEQQRCVVEAVGGNVLTSYADAPLVIDQGGPVAANIAMSCDSSGIVRINDPDAFMFGEVLPGAKAVMRTKTYRFLPTQVRAMVAMVDTTG